MYRLGCVLIRQPRRSVHTWLAEAPSMMTSRPIAGGLLKGSLLDSQVKPRLLSSLDTEESVLNPFSIVEDDMKNLYSHVVSMLRDNIKNNDMFNIAHSYYEGLDNNVGVFTAFNILVGKALNCHIFNDGKLTDNQIKVMAIGDLIFSGSLLVDDVVDESETRHGVPAAHVRWGLYKVAVTSRMITGICMKEAAKLKNNVTASLFLQNELTYRGFFMPFLHDYWEGNIFTNYLEIRDQVFASPMTNLFCAIARSVNSTEQLENFVSKFGINFGMGTCLIDDIRDFEKDISSGIVTAPLFFAMKEHPVLEEMMKRRFKEKGDIERAIELVKNSRGYEESRILARSYYQNVFRYLNLLVDSPYRSGLQTCLQYVLSTANEHFEENIHMDMLGVKGL